MSNRYLYFKRPKASKYRSKSCQCHSGHYHQSVFEAEYCDQLSLLVRAGEIREFKTQVPVELKVNGEKVCSHIVDFEVITKDGELEVHEVKGFPTEVWQLKYKLFKALLPDIPYIIVRRGDNDPRNKYRSERRRRPY